MIETGKRISLYIKANGYTRKGIAKALGITDISVYKWIRGATAPSIDNLIILSILFHCKIDDLIVISETGTKAVAAEQDEGQQAINS